MAADMELYLMRHAEAVAHYDWGGDDAKRPLTDKGRMALEAACVGFKKANLSVGLILTSPYVRALETAKIVAGACGMQSPVVKPDLSSGATIKKYRAVVGAALDKGPALLVGHMPDLAHYASSVTGDPWLLDGARMEPGEIWALETGTMEGPWGTGKILWQKTLSQWAGGS